MTLKQFLDASIGDVPFTVGTLHGRRWLVYFDGENRITIPAYLGDRKVEFFYMRLKRKRTVMFGETFCHLKKGIGIIVEGDEDGNI